MQGSNSAYNSSPLCLFQQVSITARGWLMCESTTGYTSPIWGLLLALAEVRGTRHHSLMSFTMDEKSQDYKSFHGIGKIQTQDLLLTKRA